MEWGRGNSAGTRLRDDHYGSALGLVLYSPQSFVCLVKREDLDLRRDADFAGQFQEVAGILAGHVGYAADPALAPEELVVVEDGHAVEVDGVGWHYGSPS